MENKIYQILLQLNDYKISLDDLKITIDTIYKSFNQFKTDIDTSIKKSVRELSTQISDVSTKLNKIDLLEKDFKEIQKDFTKISNDLTDLNELLGTNQKILEGELSKVKNEIKSLQSKLDTLQPKKIEDLIRKLEEFENNFPSKIGNIEKELEDAKKRNKLQFIIFVVIIVVGLIGSFIGKYFNNDEVKNTTDSIPSIIKLEKSYTKIQQEQVKSSAKDNILQLPKVSDDNKIGKIDEIKKLFIENADISLIINSDTIIDNINLILGDLKVLDLTKVELLNTEFNENKISKCTIKITHESK